MPAKNESHWPFSGDAASGQGWDRAEGQREKARMQQAAFRQKMRHDRLIVGGRAHVKKSSLS